MTTVRSDIEEFMGLEEARPKMVTNRAQVPGRYEAITVEWLTDVLCGNATDARVVNFRLGDPDNGSSNRRRITLQYNEAGNRAALPSTVFCKAATTAATRQMLGAGGIAQTEVSFFNSVRPHLNILAPEAYYANFDPVTLAYILVLKDMSGEVEFPAADFELSRAHAESQVRTLARLHSRFYNDTQLNGAPLPFQRWDQRWIELLSASPGYTEGCARAVDDCRHLMSAELWTRRAEIWPKTMESVRMHATLPQMLTHVDVHLRNWFITKDAQMGLNDWALCAIGNWSRDFAYAIGTSLSIEQRRHGKQIYCDYTLTRCIRREFL